jgi:NAD(P)-dependent dehydrogenase (short-subunit alcohol dehydrogenase family)
MENLRNRVVAITGAASGIGRALAVELAREGAELALSDINETGLAETVNQVRDAGVPVTHRRLDVADRQAVHAWADAVVEEHGRVNVIVNNAGVAVASTISDLTYEDFEWLMGINFWGVVHGTKAFLPHLRQAGEGHIVNVSSVFGMIGVPTQGAYNAAKFAVRGFTECLRQELDDEGGSVSATCVQPGGIRTNIARAARMSERLEGKRDQHLRRFDAVARTSPEAAARVIIEGIRRNRARVLVGADAHLIDVAQRVLPARYRSLTRRLASRARR